IVFKHFQHNLVNVMRLQYRQYMFIHGNGKSVASVLWNDSGTSVVYSPFAVFLTKAMQDKSYQLIMGKCAYGILKKCIIGNKFGLKLFFRKLQRHKVVRKSLVKSVCEGRNIYSF